MSSEAHAHEASHLAHHFDTPEQQKSAATLGMWAFLVTEVMFFGGLFAVYATYRLLYHDGFVAGSQELDILLGGINTVVLICSSLTMALGVHAASVGKGRQAALWIFLTVLLGTVFLGIKVEEYKHKFDHHLVPGESFAPDLPPNLRRGAEIYFCLYFAMTGLHATHMLIGIPILLILAWNASQGRYSKEYSTPVEMVGLYWHFVDIVWIFLFPLLYLIHPGRH